jgi:hypothetical protein
MPAIQHGCKSDQVRPSHWGQDQVRSPWAKIFSELTNKNPRQRGVVFVYSNRSNPVNPYECLMLIRRLMTKG